MSIPLVLNSSLTCDVSSELFERHSKKIISFKEQINSPNGNNDILLDLFQKEKLIFKNIRFDNLPKNTNYNFELKFSKNNFESLKNNEVKKQKLEHLKEDKNIGGGNANGDEEDSDEKPIQIELKIERNSDVKFSKNKSVEIPLTDHYKPNNEPNIEERTKIEKTERKQENYTDSFKKLEELKSFKNEEKSHFISKPYHKKTDTDKQSKKLKDSMKKELLDNEFKIKIPENLFNKA